MRVYKTSSFKLTEQTVVTLGNFDGLHAGHKRLFTAARDFARKNGALTAVFSFFPHPTAFFTGAPFRYIYTPDEKTYLLQEELGADIYFEYPFGDVFELPPERFITDVLVKRLNCRAVAVGENYRFGKNREGDVSTLISEGGKLGFDVFSAPLLLDEDGAKISSSVIRGHISQTRFEDARKLLTRPYFIRTTVTGGERLGRVLGFPTVNQTIPPLKLTPPNGVYATTVTISKKTYKGATNVGVKPTVSDKNIVAAETFITGFDGDLYGDVVQVDFLRKLRDEQKFPNIDALKAQITQDLKQL
jgi:riboflavin kinase/FMN adenylyltransferase